MNKHRQWESLYAHLLILMLAVLIPVQGVGAYILLDSARHVRSVALEKSEQALFGAMDYLETKIDSVFQRPTATCSTPILPAARCSRSRRGPRPATAGSTCARSCPN